MAGGRPTVYTEKLALEICERLAEGESLRSICKDDHMPARGNVFKWLLSKDETYSGFRDQYALAREIQAESLVDDIFDIADNGTNDYVERNDPNNQGYEVNGEAIARSRLRVDTRKWHASKIITRYKDKIEKEKSIVVQNIMPVPVADSIESWEQVAKSQQGDLLGKQ